MFAKLESLERKYEELERELSDPAVLADQDHYRKLAKAHADLADMVATFREHKRLSQELAENQELAQDSDPEMRELAQAEVKSIKDTLVKLEEGGGGNSRRHRRRGSGPFRWRSFSHVLPLRRNPPLESGNDERFRDRLRRL